MVLLMEGPECDKAYIGECREVGIKVLATDVMKESVLESLPFPMDRSLVYDLHDLDLALLASGFFGDIFKAYHRPTEKTMVLKKDKQNLDDFCVHENSLMYEAEILSQIRHPNIIRFLGICISDLDNQVHLLIEYINGGNLEELLMDHDEVLDWGTRVYLARDIADGMSYLHKNRIIHRDLASKNCLIKLINGARYGVVADLGLATHLPDNDEGVKSVVGSPYNMAPELLRGERYDSKADVFSYGIIMCEVIGRVQADPDELPRTGSFGLDVDKFKTMVGDCPIEFLHTAVCCCQMDPQSRPSFSATVKQLEAILVQYPRRPEMPFESHSVNDTISEDIPLDNSFNNNNFPSSVCSGTSSGQLLSPSHTATETTDHRHRSNSENKKRLSWISSRYKLFHTATDDLLKHTPAKLMGFFKNVIGLRSKDHTSLLKGKRRSHSSSVLTRVSPLPTEKTAQFFPHGHDQTDSSLAVSDTACLSASCPGTPGTSGHTNRHFSKEFRRHTISPSTVQAYSKNTGPGLLYINHTESISYTDKSHSSDIMSMSSGFDSMTDSGSTVESASLYTNSEDSSRHSSLRRDTSLTVDGNDDTTTCKNLRALNFDRCGSYSVINAEASSRQQMEKDMTKEKLEGLKESTPENTKTKKRMRSPMLLSFFLGNRSKSKDSL